MTSSNFKTKELSIDLHVGGERCLVSLKSDFFGGGEWGEGGGVGYLYTLTKFASIFMSSSRDEFRF